MEQSVVSLTMAPSSANGEAQPKLQHPWTFRRTQDDLDSSSDESDLSRPSGEPFLKRPKLAACLVPVNHNDGNNDGAAEADDAIEVWEKTNRRSSRVTKKGHRRMSNGSKSNAANASVQVSVNELKNYMSSLLDEMKDTRRNLLTWLKEELKNTIAEEVASELQRRQQSFRPQQQTGDLEGTQAPQFEHQSDSRQHTQMQLNSKPMEHGRQHQVKNSEENNGMLNLPSIRESIKQQQEHPFSPFRGDHNSDAGTPKRLANKVTRPSSNVGTHNPNDCCMEIVPVTPVGRDKPERFLLSVKSDSLTSPSGLEIQEQQQPKIVLGMGATRISSGFSRRHRRSKRVTESGDHYKVPEGKEIVSVTSSPEKDNATSLEFCANPSFTSNPYGQVTPSMYLTFPTLLTRSHRPNQNQAPTGQPNRVQRSDRSLNVDGRNALPGSGSYLGHLLQQDERSSRSFAPVGAMNINRFGDSSSLTSPISGSGFPIGLHQSVNSNLNIPSLPGLEGPSRESSHGIGLRMGGGGIRFSGGSYCLPGQHIPNNFHQGITKPNGKGTLKKTECSNAEML